MFLSLLDIDDQLFNTLRSHQFRKVPGRAISFAHHFHFHPNQLTSKLQKVHLGKYITVIKC